MTTVDLGAIADKAWSSYRKEAAVSNAIAQKMLEAFPDGEKLYNEVNDRATTYGKPLLFKTSDTAAATYTAQTQEYKNSIDITCKRTLDTLELPSILLHELGEADYIVRGLPEVIDEKDRENYHSRILELFSHPHARILAASYNLEQIEGRFRIRLFENYRRKDYLEYDYDWQKVLMIAWACATFPVIKDIRSQLSGYTEFQKPIERIIQVIEDTDTFGSIRIVEEAISEVIVVLKVLGLSGMIMKSRRVE